MSRWDFFLELDCVGGPSTSGAGGDNCFQESFRIREEVPQGLKPRVFLGFSARLKPRPSENIGPEPWSLIPKAC